MNIISQILMGEDNKTDLFYAVAIVNIDIPI